MTEQEIKDLVTRQRSYFQSGATLPVSARLAALRRLYDAISSHEKEIRRALQKDLGKSGFESYMCETGMVLEEISYMLKHTPKFAREQRVHTPLAQFCSRSYKKPSPYGVTLIMSPWNYPFMLTLSPLADALAAGNTAVVKPSAYSPYTSEVLLSILTECFDPKYVAVVTGGRAENTCLLREHFDYIFFTGSQAVGKEVMRGERRIMVATSAFGMGINKSDVRLIIHYNLPLSLIDYYQQAGRAGRDGGKARCILLYSKSDYDINRYVIEQNQELRALDYSQKALDEMKEYADSDKGCMVQRMLAALGEQLDKPCGRCTCCQKARVRA